MPNCTNAPGSGFITSVAGPDRPRAGLVTTVRRRSWNQSHEAGRSPQPPPGAVPLLRRFGGVVVVVLAGAPEIMLRVRVREFVRALDHPRDGVASRAVQRDLTLARLVRAVPCARPYPWRSRRPTPSLWFLTSTHFTPTPLDHCPLARHARTSERVGCDPQLPESFSMQLRVGGPR